MLFVLPACSSSDAPATESATATNADFNADDVMFSQMMIPHHEQAIEMADIALDPTIGASEEVRALATQIKAAQDPEIMQMKDLLNSWGETMEMSGSMDHSSGMAGMLSADEMARLSTLTGAEFDRAWIEGMIAHHNGAIDMAKVVVGGGKSAEAIELGNAIIAAQTSEIAELQDLLSRIG
jgi:uncharacterized protein (DUF305 family)